MASYNITRLYDFSAQNRCCWYSQTLLIRTLTCLNVIPFLFRLFSCSADRRGTKLSRGELLFDKFPS